MHAVQWDVLWVVRAMIRGIVAISCDNAWYSDKLGIPFSSIYHRTAWTPRTSRFGHMAFALANEEL